MSEPSAELIDQYKEISEVIESEGLSSGIANGYLNTDTEDERLNEAIISAEEAIAVIEEILAPYRI